MKKIFFSLLGLIGTAGFVEASPSRVCIPAQPVTNYYKGFTNSGSGAPFNGLIGSTITRGIKFGSITTFNWHPSGFAAFGADTITYICVPTQGAKTFALNSDDGSRLFIDNNLVVDHGGPHPPTVKTGTTTLQVGTHKVEVQMFEDFGGASGVDLDFVNGSDVRYGALVDAHPDEGNCKVKASASLSTQFATLDNAATQLGYFSVADLQVSILRACTPKHDDD